MRHVVYEIGSLVSPKQVDQTFTSPIAVFVYARFSEGVRVGDQSMRHTVVSRVY